MRDFPIRHAGHGRNRLAHAADAALGVGERPVFFEERRSGEEDVRVAGGLIQEKILDHHAFHRGHPGRHVLRVGIGLDNVLALNVHALEGAFAGGVQHVGDAQSGLALQRDVPGLFEQMAHAVVGDMPVSGEFVRERSHVAGALHVVLAAQRIHAHAAFAEVAGGHGEIGHAHHHGGSLAVLGDAESVVDGCIAAGGIEPGRGAQIGGRNPAGGFGCFGRIALFGDELAPLLEGFQIAALADERLVHQALGDDDVRHGVDDRDVGAGQQRQMIIRLHVRRSSPDRCGADRRRSAARPRAAAASCARRTRDARRWDWRRSP